ncbi:RN213-like protein, partial [Mya arenaria]
IYSYDKHSKSKQILPRTVLFCTSKTTVDELDIFFRRALFDTQRSIYCLLFADQMNYDATENASQLLQKYQTYDKYNKEFQLVIICEARNEFESTFVSSLEKCKRTLNIDLNRVREYVSTNLRISNFKGYKDFAGNIDFEE